MTTLTFGECGAGKSTVLSRIIHRTNNCLLKKKQDKVDTFKAAACTESVTKCCSEIVLEDTDNDREKFEKLVVIDAPGINDPSGKNEEIPLKERLTDLNVQLMMKLAIFTRIINPKQGISSFT